MRHLLLRLFLRGFQGVSLLRLTLRVGGGDGHVHLLQFFRQVIHHLLLFPLGEPPFRDHLLELLVEVLDLGVHVHHAVVHLLLLLRECLLVAKHGLEHLQSRLHDFHSLEQRALLREGRRVHRDEVLEFLERARDTLVLRAVWTGVAAGAARVCSCSLRRGGAEVDLREDVEVLEILVGVVLVLVRAHALLACARASVVLEPGAPQRLGEVLEHVRVILAPRFLAAADDELAPHVRLRGQGLGKATGHEILDPARAEPGEVVLLAEAAKRVVLDLIAELARHLRESSIDRSTPQVRWS